MKSKIYIVGTGPGSEEYLTKKAIKIVENTNIIIGRERTIKLFPHIDNKIIFNAKNFIKKLEESIDLAIKGHDVAILSTGDPGFSGILNSVLKIANKKKYPIENIEVIPGISSIQLAAAKNYLQWDNCNITTFHGREDIKDILKIVNNNRTTITLPSKKVKDMAKFLIDNGISPDREVTVCERLSYDDENIIHTTLKELVNIELTYMCIMIL